jgi:hypothetical protein
MMRKVRELITLAVGVGAGVICRLAELRPAYGLAAVVITIMLLKADRSLPPRQSMVQASGTI